MGCKGGGSRQNRCRCMYVCLLDTCCFFQVDRLLVVAVAGLVCMIWIAFCGFMDV